MQKHITRPASNDFVIENEVLAIERIYLSVEKYLNDYELTHDAVINAIKNSDSFGGIGHDYRIIVE